MPVDKNCQNENNTSIQYQLYILPVHLEYNRGKAVRGVTSKYQNQTLPPYIYFGPQKVLIIPPCVTNIKVHCTLWVFQMYIIYRLFKDCPVFTELL